MLQKKMKKILAALLTLCLIFSISACKGGGTDTPEEEPKASDPVDVDDPEDDDKDEEEEEEEEEEESVFEAHDLGGVTIVAYDANSLHDRNPDVEDIDEIDKEERQEKLDEIEKKYNCKIEFNEPPQVEWWQVGSELVKAYTAGDPYGDIMDVSYLYTMEMVNNDAIHDDTEWMKDEPIASEYKDVMTWHGKNYGIGTLVGGEGLLYNRELIKQAGMEYEPNEMFARGHWSYDDFEEYLGELKANLPEDTYPFFIDPYYWFLYAPAGNGTELINDQVGANYKDPAVVESLEFLRKIWDKGYCREANLTEDGDLNYWGTPADTFEQGKEVVMTHRASWQASALVDKLDFGFVPYPWGKNVTVEDTGDDKAYLTLSDNYVVSCHDAQTKTMVNGIEEKADPKAVFYMFMDWIDHDYIVENYYKEQRQEADEEEPLDTRWFSTELDAELFDWSIRRERLERYAGLSPLFELAGDYYKAFHEDKSVQSIIDAALPVDQATMVEQGFIKE